MFDLHRDTAMGLTMCDVTGHTLSESCLINNRIYYWRLLVIFNIVLRNERRTKNKLCIVLYKHDEFDGFYSKTLSNRLTLFKKMETIGSNCGKTMLGY